MAQHRWDTVDSQRGNALDLQEADGAAPGAVELPGLRRRWALSLPAAVLAVCLLLGCGLAVVLLRDRSPVPVASVEMSSPGETPSPVVEGGGADPGTGVSLPSGAASLQPGFDTGGAETVQGPIMVHVAGAVIHPGVVRLPPGSRIVDAVEAAGGTAPEADLAGVNLAAVAQDGAMVLVPRVGETAPVPEAGSPPGGPAGGSASAATGTVGTPDGPTGKVNLNTADSAQLQTLPRVGPVLAERILAWRIQHGKFSRAEDLDAVPGIGEAMMAALLPLVTV